MRSNMNNRPRLTPFGSESRWSDFRRFLQLSPGHPRLSLAFLVLGLLAAGWVLQERAFGTPLESQAQLLPRVLVAAIPLLITVAMVLAARRK